MVFPAPAGKGIQKAFLVFLFFFLLCFTHRAMGEIHPPIPKPEAKMIKTCTKTPESIPGGPRYVTLATSNRTHVYDGPSVWCTERGTLTKDMQTVAIGKVTSSFKKSWYLIQTLDTRKLTAWVPAKRVTLGGIYTPKPDYKTSAMKNRVAVAESAVSIHECPDALCKIVGSLAPQKFVKPTRLASNGWIYIEPEPAIKGWIRLNLISLRTTEVLPQKFTPPSEKQSPQAPMSQSQLNLQKKIAEQGIDPCPPPEDFSVYPHKVVWYPAVKAENYTMTVYPHPIITCRRTISTIGNHQPFIPTRVSKDEELYEVRYVDNNTLTTGYVTFKEIHRASISNFTLPHDLQAADVKTYLEKTEAYLNSWRFSFDQWVAVFKANMNWLFSRHPFASLVVSSYVLLLLLTAIPPSRRWLLRYSQRITRALYGMLTKPRQISSHWNTMIEGLSLTPSAFYQQLDQALEQKQLPNTHRMKVELRQSGIFSPKRLYMRVRYGDSALDICGAPYGNGFFVSWWHGRIPSIFLGLMYLLPLLNWLAALIEKLFFPETYYRTDTRLMFGSAVHSAVMEVIESHTAANGLRALTKQESAPILKGFFFGK